MSHLLSLAARAKHRPIGRSKHGTGSLPGFSILELVIVIAAALIVGAMAIPATQSAYASYQLSAAVQSATGAIRSTRYQAISNGYLFQVAFDNSLNTFTVLSEIPPATSFTAVGSSVPLSAAPIQFSAPTTFQFKPDGLVSAAAGAMTFTISYKGTTKTVTVSRYGAINVQ